MGRRISVSKLISHYGCGMTALPHQIGILTDWISIVKESTRIHPGTCVVRNVTITGISMTLGRSSENSHEL